MRQRLVRRPQPLHNFHPLGEDRQVVLERSAERDILPAVVTTAGGEIDPATRQQIEACPLFCHPDRVMQREHRHCWRQPNPLRPRGHIGQRQVRTGQHAQGAEMVLPDPRRAESQPVRFDRLSHNVGHEGIRRTLVVVVVVVAQREIAEPHGVFLPVALDRAEFPRRRTHEPRPRSAPIPPPPAISPTSCIPIPT